jgi:hypothetical protein
MTIRTFDTVEEQREALEGVAQNIEGFWRLLAESTVPHLSVPAESDAKTLRTIAGKLGE